MEKQPMCPATKGKSIPLKMTKGLTQLLKTFQYENVSFRKSIYSPYSLHFATLTIKAGQTVCGVHFPSKTQVIFNEMEIDDDSFEVRPTTPVVANGKTYPKYTGRLEVEATVSKGANFNGLPVPWGPKSPVWLWTICASDKAPHARDVKQRKRNQR